MRNQLKNVNCSEKRSSESERGDASGDGGGSGVVEGTFISLHDDTVVTSVSSKVSVSIVVSSDEIHLFLADREGVV